MDDQEGIEPGYPSATPSPPTGPQEPDYEAHHEADYESYYQVEQPSPYDVPPHKKARPRRTWLLVSAIAAAGIVAVAVGGYAVSSRKSRPDARNRQPSRICTSPYGEANGYRAPPVPLPGEEPTREQQEQINKLAAQVEEVRGLRFRRPVQTKVVARDSFREWFRTALGSDTEKGQENELSRTAEIYKFLNLVPPKSDFAEEIASAYGNDIRGLYDPDFEQLLLVAEPGKRLHPQEELTLVHELVHALQDQHFDLEDHTNRLRDPYSADAQAAFKALVEGEATFVSVQYARKFFGINVPALSSLPENLLVGEESSKLPRVLRDKDAISYIAGARFVEAVHGLGGWDAVTALYSKPPQTTEVILEPTKYFRPEATTDPGKPAVIEALEQNLGERWSVIDEGSLGAADMKAFLAQYLTGGRAEAAAKVWAGGSYTYAGCDDRRVLVMIVEADDETGAGVIESAWSRYSESWSPPPGLDMGGIVDSSPVKSAVVTRSGTRTTLVFANREGLADLVVGAL